MGTGFVGSGAVAFDLAAGGGAGCVGMSCRKFPNVEPVVEPVGPGIAPGTAMGNSESSMTATFVGIDAGVTKGLNARGVRVGCCVGAGGTAAAIGGREATRKLDKRAWGSASVRNREVSRTVARPAS